MAPLAVVMLAACVHRPGVTPSPDADLSPAAVYAAVRRQEAAVRTLRARFSARVTRAGEVRRADGVLLVKKPDRFRLRLLSPFGLTVFDYTSWDGRDRMELPLEGKQLSDAEITAHAPFSPADMREVFLGTPAAADEQCHAQAGPAETVVDCVTPAADATRLLRIATATRRLVQEIHFVAGQPQLVMQFGDYRRVGDAELPFTVDLTYPLQGVQLQIAVSHYEVNPQLSDGLFNGVSPPGEGS